MELDRIYALANGVKRKLHCSYQRAEYVASLLVLEQSVGRDSFELLFEIQAIHSLLNHSTL